MNTQILTNAQTPTQTTPVTKKQKNTQRKKRAKKFKKAALIADKENEMPDDGSDSDEAIWA